MKPPLSSQPLLILGSARKESDTGRLIDQLFDPEKIKLLDLLDYPLYHYAYTGHYPADDAFQEITRHLLAHQLLVFATPVYWYSMSGLMKVLFDRFTDLVTIEKSKGRQLKGKQAFLLAVGNSDAMPDGFDLPFKQTADYLEMSYGGSYFCPTPQLSTGTLPAAGWENKALAHAFKKP